MWTLFFLENKENILSKVVIVEIIGRQSIDLTTIYPTIKYFSDHSWNSLSDMQNTNCIKISYEHTLPLLYIQFP